MQGATEKDNAAFREDQLKSFHSNIKEIEQRERERESNACKTELWNQNKKFIRDGNGSWTRNLKWVEFAYSAKKNVHTYFGYKGT